ncbi:DUF2799 domain-containing protein [Oricola indica]|uniref:DUF2799 domain-containing protein n=1 Tax=Oricola indica TaxID=2872591 RepID=UPI003CCBFCDD
MIARLSLLILAFVGALALASCQTLNEKECTSSDWRTLGATDGFAGRQQSHVARHQEACNRFGITVDVTAWQAGWQDGIRRHCTPRNGLDIGLKGRGYSSACPADLAFAYREAYDIGRDVNWAKDAVERLEDELDDAIKALAVAGPDERQAAQVEIELKRSELFRAQNRLNRAERKADLYKLRLATSG